MNFNFETQGAITYLVCELDSADQLDTLTLGMLTNNHISGLAPVLYTEMNGQRFLKYNISAKVSAEQFFGGNMTKQRTIGAFQNILNSLCAADEYMIDQNCFSVLPEHVFLNVSNCETALICIPVESSKDINAEVANFFKKILFSTQFDQSEDAGYITQMISCINNSAFNVYGFKDLVDKIANGTAPQVQAPVRTASAPQQPKVPVPPASSYNETISIDEVPELKKQTPSQPIPSSPIRQQPVTPKNIPQQPAYVKPQTPPQQVPPKAAGMPNRPMNVPVPAGNPIPTQSPNKQKQPMQNIPKPPARNNPGFAIPGQKPNVPKKQADVPPTPAALQNTGEKKMSFFGLISHYNKENAELYKAQKEAKKAQSAKQKKNKPDIQQPNVPNQPNIVPPINGGPVPPVEQYHPPVQPIPVQNSFNETTVLSAIGGETTVLSENIGVGQPYLTRLKTGERIVINKPVFRIGKEKSYVDYFIADNTAISRSHCNIHTENGEYFIEDTNSTNHTYVNGNIINSNVKTKLTNGDKIRLANEDFSFSL